jgi:hypothetical protein
MLNVGWNVRAEALTYLRNNGQNKRSSRLGMAEMFAILDEE